MNEEKLIPESWFWKIRDEIKELKKCQFEEVYNNTLDDIVKEIAHKFQDLGIKIYYDEGWSP